MSIFRAKLSTLCQFVHIPYTLHPQLLSIIKSTTRLPMPHTTQQANDY